MSKTRFAVAVLPFLFTDPASAATQGTLGTTSTGSMTMTAQGPATPRQVQVTGLTDPVFTNTDRSEYDAGVPGATVAFCLVDTYAGTLSLSITSTNGSLGGGYWSAKSAGGASIGYQFLLTGMSGTQADFPTGGSNSMSVVMPFSWGRSVTNAGACGAGTVKAHMRLAEPMPNTLPAVSYSDVITFVLTPQ